MVVVEGGRNRKNHFARTGTLSSVGVHSGGIWTYTF